MLVDQLHAALVGETAGLLLYLVSCVKAHGHACLSCTLCGEEIAFYRLEDNAA